MSSSRQARLYRTAFDLLAARACGEHQLFQAVLEEMREDFGDLCAVGTFAVANTALQVLCADHGCGREEVLARVRVGDAPATRGVAAAVLDVLRTGSDDLGAACERARLLGEGPQAGAAMVVFTDVSLALVARMAAVAALAPAEVAQGLRGRFESMIAGDCVA